MKKIFFLPMILGMLFFVTSCEESLPELNIDPAIPSTVNLSLSLPEALVSSAFNEGTNPNRVAGIIMQQFLGLDAQQLGYNTYLIGADAMNGYWGTGLYAGVLRSCDVLIKGSIEDERPFYGAVAKIVMANEYGKAASMFGDIPFSEALQGTDNLTPAYDSQEAVYAGVQAMLSEAAAELEAMADGGGYFGGDVVFDGDAAAWAKAAHAFKARYYMHTSKRNNGDYANAIAEVDQAFTSNADAPTFQFDITATANWSLAKFGIERPATLGVSNSFADMMNGDPRRDVYLDTLAVNADNGDITYGYFDAAIDGNLIWGQSDANVPLISYVELMFIKAEANAQLNGAAPGMLADAITASFDLLGVEDDGYIAENSATGDVAQIMEEAYKAYFGFNFHETWANWRRTGFPALTPGPNTAEGLNPSGVIPRRYLYVTSETQTNNDNVDAAKGRQGGGLLDQTTWAFE